MKRQTWFGLVFTICIAIGIGIAGCDTATDTGTQYSIDPAEVGEMHNEALDFMLAELKHNKVAKIPIRDPRGKRDALFARMEDGCRQFLATKGLDQEGRDCELGFKAVLKAEASGSSLGLVAVRTGSYFQYFNQDATLEERQEFYLAQIFQALQNSTGDDLGGTLDAIADQATAELGDDDAVVIVVASSVAKASTAYWDDNLDDWVNALADHAGVSVDSLQGITGNMSANMVQPYCVVLNCTEMAGADVAGAAAGAAAGVITGPGVGTTALAGAAGGSVGNAVTQVWDIFF